MTCGVSQGSILRPLLFACYINDIIVSIDADSKLILYADDSAILFAHKDADFISQNLITVMKSCSELFVDNKLP